ncbi:heme-binding protein [Pusillimonas sp. ANT_WB101]|uniref:GlcG/HbpS family heme-binding protein n=1 Tax=Pusillimonas sp. ANT_WB101 TaxID=2597356 RepID=UPI0011EBE214|nr:heme-binding protein [Pusillimonas sp. ANT_WB101]KAA0892671.1 heme-binding protein [Pusillimonas sp. ANT_WB101]
MILKLSLAAFLCAPILATAATQLPSSPYLPLDLATKAAQAALKACSAQGHNVSVAIVARDGATKVLLKADNSGPHTASSAEGKAFTSAALGRDTAGLAEFIASKPANNGLRDMDSRLIIQAGGLPIKFDKVLVAGIGVGGAPSGDIDAGCAVEGLKAIGAD